jgi:hypothetical protein
MIIALLVLLGVDLAVVAVLWAGLILRRRSVKTRRGVFKGKLRVTEGELDGFSEKWKAGYGHWVRNVLVWDMAPFFFRSRLVPVDGTDVSGIHCASGSIKRLGKHPIVAPLLSDHHSRLELATSDEDRDLALGPFARTLAIGSLVQARYDVGDLGFLYPHDN